MATSTIITFTGLLVFRRDPATRHYDVGILRARDAHHSHILQIHVDPDPKSGHGIWEIPQEDLERHIQNKHTRWQLDVDGSSPMGIESKPDKPGDRHRPSATNRRDLGWIINIENHEFHSRKLTRERNALQPIIRLKHGTLFSSCKTDSVDKIQGEKVEHLGFIAGAIGLEIDTSDGQQPVLNFENQHGEKVEIFRLLRTNEVSYKVSIFNTPEKGTHSVGDHFLLYYDRLFKGVRENERFNLKVHKEHGNPIPPPAGDVCPEAAEFATPDPFKCGGILVEEGDPLE